MLSSFFRNKTRISRHFQTVLGNTKQDEKLRYNILHTNITWLEKSKTVVPTCTSNLLLDTWKIPITKRYSRRINLIYFSPPVTVFHNLIYKEFPFYRRNCYFLHISCVILSLFLPLFSTCNNPHSQNIGC